MGKTVDAPVVRVVEEETKVALRKTRAVAVRARQPAGVSVNPEALLLAAVKGKATPEAMRAIMDMRRELVQEQARREYYDALAEFQKELKPIIKTKVVRNKQEKIDRGEAEEVRFRYAPIEMIARKIQEGCDSHGFSYDFDSGDMKEHSVPVFCDIHHVGGYSTRHTFPSPVQYEKGAMIGQSPAQVVNGAITFGRRVALVMGFGIMTADPDPERAEGENAKALEEPRAVGDAALAPVAKKTATKPPTDEQIGAVYSVVLALIDEKATGKAADTFKATASKHLQAGRADLLDAMAKSLRTMRQGVRR